MNRLNTLFHIMQREPINWKDSVWFFDIDDTLTDTSDISHRAANGIEKVFTSRFDASVGSAIKNKVNDYYNLMLAGVRIKDEKGWVTIPGGKVAFQNLLHLVEGFQQNIIKQFGVAKKWSREVFVKLAADELAIKVTPELVHEAVDAYWTELSQITKSFDDAVALIKTIKEHHRPIYLLTSSDGRLQLQDDNQFLYNPVYSEALKRERIELLRNKGIEFNLLSIGDPEDKPHRDFFEKGIARAAEDLGQSINLKNAVMIGDSFVSDLQTPKEQLGFGMVVLIDRSGEPLHFVDSQQVNTNNLIEIGDLLIS